MNSPGPVSSSPNSTYSRLPAGLAAAQQFKPLSWEQDGRDWPNRDASRFVESGGLHWHVQVMGQGPGLLLLHGTGATSHSWRDLCPILARHYTVIAPDLPGHGFTQTPPGQLLSLPGMTSLLIALLQTLGCRPQLLVGHSAGAAIAAQMCLDGGVAPGRVVSLNGAFLPWSGLAGRLFSPLARFLAHRRIWARLLAQRAAERGVVERLIDRTGSRLDARGIELYGRVIRNEQHTAAALGMMANWDLNPLLQVLPKLQSELVLVVGENDQMVPPEQADKIQALLPAARIVRLPGLGHLLHEEQPGQTASLLLALDHPVGSGQTS